MMVDDGEGEKVIEGDDNCSSLMFECNERLFFFTFSFLHQSLIQSVSRSVSNVNVHSVQLHITSFPFNHYVLQ